MVQESIYNLIRRVEIFNDLPEDLLKDFSDKLNIESYLPDTTIIQKGDHGDSMFVIASGKVKIHDGDHVVAYTDAGNFFGEFSLLDAGPRSMSVTTTEKTDVIPFTRELFFELFQSQPEVAKKITSALTKRLRKQNE